MTKQELFVKHHWKQSIILGLITIIMMGLQIGSEELILYKRKNKTGQILGVTTRQNVIKKNNQMVNKEENIVYQNKIRTIITNYLQQRATFNKPHQDWLFLINITKQKILALNTPIDYKNFQLKVILLLDKEKDTLTNYQPQKLENINKHWDSLLEQFWWLK